jgi:hypothetical protein
VNGYEHPFASKSMPSANTSGEPLVWWQGAETAQTYKAEVCLEIPLSGFPVLVESWVLYRDLFAFLNVFQSMGCVF